MRACTKCGELKPLGAFPPVRRGEPKLQTWCRDCFAAYGREYYRRNREAQKARLLRNTAARRVDNRARAIDYLRAHPCVDCGETDIVVLQFDHIRDKKKDLATMIASGSTWASIEQEIAKCEVRCANCHRLRTALRSLQRRSPRTLVVTRPEQLRIGDALPRICRVCKETKPLTEFPFRSREAQTRHWICLSCQRVAARSWYVERVPNARKFEGYGTFVRESLARRVDEYLATHPCVDCGEANIALLDFDHLRDKTKDVSDMIRDGASWEQIADEIAKCDVRCANCHARATASRVGAYRLATA
jgi:mono/diheme cytochrome c family protein